MRRRLERPRIVFAHVYSMGAARAGWSSGQYPGQHLFGTTALDEMAEVIDLPARPRRGRMWVGDLRQQAAVLLSRLRWGRGVLCLAGEDSVVSLLLVLRRIGLAPPVVVIAHEQPGRVAHLGIRGADQIVALSRRLADLLVEDAAVDPARVQLAPWGPDLTFRGYQSRGSEFVLSVGKTARDRTTLLRALQQLSVPARVYTDDPSDIALAGACAAVEIRPTTGDAAAVFTYDHVLADLQRAAVFAVPLHEPRRTVGITELDDALALGKPIVMTRNPYIDCDIEAVGCGIWVDEGDVDGWVSALGRLMASPELRDSMGRRGREYAERSWNSELFSRVVVDAVTRVVDGDAHRRAASPSSSV